MWNEKVGSNRVHFVSFHLYEVSEQLQLTYGSRNQTSGCFWKRRNERQMV